MSAAMEQYSMDLPALIDLMRKWRKKIVLFLFLLGLTTASVLYMMKNRYYSYSSAIPTNSSLTDKGYLFSTNLDALYPSLGSYSDLDRLFSTATLDTSYKFLIHRFDLIRRYRISAPNENIAVQKAIFFMSDDLVKIEKTEQGLLRIHVTDENADTAAAMANALMGYVNEVNTNLQMDYNRTCSERAKEHLAKMNDSLSMVSSAREELEKIKTQFDLSIGMQQPALRVVEAATPCYKPVAPKRWYSFISVLILGFISSIFIIAIIESIKPKSKP